MNTHPTYGWDILDVVLDFVLKSARRGHCCVGNFKVTRQSKREKLN
jgi:hypothetical protein